MKKGFVNRTKTVDEMCTCIPSWLGALIKPPLNNQCSCCGVSFEEKTMRFCQTIMCPCPQWPKRVHCFGIQMHDECTAKYQDELRKKHRGETIDVLPFSLENLSSENLEKYSELCLQRHKYTTLCCGYCRTREQEGRSMKICSGCKIFRYCDDECQRLDWQNHKTFCKEKSQGMKNAKEKIGRFKRVPRCFCFTAYELAIADHCERRICSNPACSVPIGGPTCLSTYLSMCTAITGKQLVPHIIPLAYCSSHCQKTGAKHMDK